MRVAEDERLEQTITREDFSRIYIRLKEDLAVAQQDLFKLSDNHHKTIKVLDEVLALVENLYETYKTAPNDIKRTYLRMFIDKVLIDDKKIVEVKLTPIAQKLLEIEQVRISGEIRRGRDSNPRLLLYRSTRFRDEPFQPLRHLSLLQKSFFIQL